MKEFWKKHIIIFCAVLCVIVVLSNDCSITKNELKFLGNTEFSCQKVYNKCMENS